MRRYKHFGKNILTSLFIFGIVFQNVFFLFPQNAQAQVESSGGVGAYFGGSLDVGGLGATVLSCVFPNGIVGAITGLFNGGGGGQNPTGGPTGTQTTGTTPSTFDGLGGGASSTGMNDTVPVTDDDAIDAIETADSNLTANKDDKNTDQDNETNGQIDQGVPQDPNNNPQKTPDGVLVDILGEDKKMNKKERCLDKIGKYMATKMLDEITLATVNWINSGFEGQPLYISDPEGFFTNIATEEINLVTGRLTDPEAILKYPFGEAIMTSILTSLQRDFYHEAQFSLNEVLAHGTYEEFHEDFSVGGWAGYTASFAPNNNPFGAYFETQDQIARKIRGTSNSRAINFQRELEEAGGFLSQRQCVVSGTGGNDYNIPGDDIEDDVYVPPGGQIPDAVYAQVGYDTESGFPPTEAQADAIDVYVLRSQCTQWKNVTPGGVISDQIKQAVNIPNEELLLVDELNESIGLIIDALLTQLVTEGLESLSDTDPTQNVLLAQVQGYQPGAEANGIVPPPTTTDIITGEGDLIDYSLVEIQGYYIDNIEIALPILYTNPDSLIKKIRALDYCVPGPNPRWIIDTEDALVTLIQNTPVFLAQPVDSNNQNGIEQSEIDAANDLNEAHYAGLIETMTGVQIEQGPEMDRYDEFVDFMENVFIKYNQRMQDDFSLTQAPPSVRVVLPGLFDDMENYMNQVSFMQDYLINIGGVLDILADIEATLADIQSQNGGVLDENDPAVQAQLSVYDQISDQIVSQQDLQDLISAIAQYNAESANMDNHVISCINQTAPGNGYGGSRQRVPYPADLPYAFYANMPNPNSNGFLPDVNGLGDGSNNTIDVTFDGVSIDDPSTGLGVFEATLQKLY